MSYLPYYYEGSIYSYNGSIIEDPAILIDSTDVFVSYGNYDKVYDKYEEFINSYNMNSLSNMIKELKLIRFNSYENILGNQRLCYILRRCIEYTATGFVKKLWYMIDTNEKDFLIWIDREIERIPIDIERS